MKHKLRLHLIGIVILLFCVSCGQSIKETVKPVIPEAASGQFKRVVIVPFADHTQASSLYDHCRRNALVLEAVQDALYKTGFISAAEEDVVQYLMEQQVIQVSSSDSAPSGIANLEREMHGGWSDQMKEEIEEIIFQEITSSRAEKNQTQKPVALNHQLLKELGNTFGADYIVRGRIIEFRPDQKDSFNPLSTGIIPFVFKSGQRTIFGVAESEGYEKVDMDAIENYDRLRAMGWGAGGFVTGLIGDKQGRVSRATVQIRVLVQDARTGQVIWLNRAEACAAPSSAFAEQKPELLFGPAIDQAVNSLIGDFAAALNSGRIAAMEKKVSAPEVEKGPEVTEGASEEAERSAMEARESARQAEEAAAQAKEAVERAREASDKSEKVFEKIIEK